MSAPLTAYIGKAAKHQIQVTSRDGSSISASDFDDIVFTVYDPGQTAIIEKRKSVSGDLTLLTGPCPDTIYYQVNVAVADTTGETAMTYYWLITATPTGGEAEVADTGLYELRSAS